jgi:hydrogenase maturation protein HypF
MSAQAPARDARRLRVTGVVQGVGFRPFIYRLAHAHALAGWVLNAQTGVEIHVEGDAGALRRFAQAIESEAPAAARIASLDERAVSVEGFDGFAIRESLRAERPTVRVSPDLPVCAQCLSEMFDPRDRRVGYPYINCTNCGPRYSIVLGLPYDRPRTTMRDWPLCEACRSEYEDPIDRRFHAQPVACAACGPTLVLRAGERRVRGAEAIAETIALLRDGSIVAIKGLGGYHLACDARRPESVQKLRERKYRKERPFALMVGSLEAARALVELSPDAENLLTSIERPIVIAPATVELAGIAPDNRDYGIMLPYTPLQHALFAGGAPDVMVMTSANRSSEPIAYRDADAVEQLSSIADALLIGEREIARRVDDSVTRVGPFGPMVLRRARGYAPGAVALLPSKRAVLALGADLKNAITLVVDGQAFVSQHVGDLVHYAAFESFRETVRDLCAMYDVPIDGLLVVHDAHPEYASTGFAQALAAERLAVQHHRAHVASVLAEREEFVAQVIGVAFDGTGYGDDGTIWGGEFFRGSVRDGFERVMALRGASLPGGDAAATFPVQAAAGFLLELEGLPDLAAAPFDFPDRYFKARQLARAGLRTFKTSSVGRLFDTVAALCGFTRAVTFEAQAAMWLEHLAEGSARVRAYDFPVRDCVLDYRLLLAAIVEDRVRGRSTAEIAYAFHAAIAGAVVEACNALGQFPVVASGGVFQNRLLVAMLADRLGTRLWLNARVPANDGGISLGQAAIAAFPSH